MIPDTRYMNILHGGYMKYDEVYVMGDIQGIKGDVYISNYDI